MGRILDSKLFDHDRDEMLAFVTARGRATHNVCQGCVAERRMMLRDSYRDLAGLRVFNEDPKTMSYDLLDSSRFALRQWGARLIRTLRHPAELPQHCFRHADRHPGWCDDCWPKEQDKRNLLIREQETALAQADELAGQELHSLADQAYARAEAKELQLERRDSRQCRHYTRYLNEVAVSDTQIGATPKRVPGLYGKTARVDCPICERVINEAVEALRDEVREGSLSPSEGKRLAEECCTLECEHVVKLGPTPTHRSDGAPPNNGLLIEDAHWYALAALSVLNVDSVTDAIDTVELRLQALDDFERGGTEESSIGLDYTDHHAMRSASRSAFNDGSDPSLSVDDITEAEVQATVHEEREARVSAQRIFGEQFEGFRHLEGGAGDILTDADVVAARFRFDELLRPFTTEDRFDIGGGHPVAGPSAAHLIEREMHPQAVKDNLDAQTRQERMALKVLLPRLRDRRNLIEEWVAEGSFDYPVTPPLELQVLTVLMSRGEQDACYPLDDAPSIWEALRFPERIMHRIRLRLDEQKRRAHEASSAVIRRRDVRPYEEPGAYDQDLVPPVDLEEVSF